MAYLSEQYTDFKLPLRHWFERQIGRFEGLEWDETAADGVKRFRLPWAKKGYPGWEQCYAIAKAWADHRGRPVQDFSDLKQNLRVNLDKSEDFEYIPSLSECDKQTGNFRMYRFVSPHELPSRKRSVKRRKKRKVDCTSLSVSEQDMDVPIAKELSAKDIDCFQDYYGTESRAFHDGGMPDIAFDSIFHPANEVYQTNLAVVPPASGGFVPESTVYSFSTAHASEGLLDEPGRMKQREIVPLPPVSGACVGDTACPFPAGHPAVGFLSDPGQVGMRALVTQTETTESMHYFTPAQQGAGIQDTVSHQHRYDRKEEGLFKCTIKVRYNSEIVEEQTVDRLDEGCVILYGDAEIKKHLLQTHVASDSTHSDYDCRRIQLPKAPSNAGETLTEAIRLAEFGIVVRLDWNTMCITVKRLCQGQVFYFNPHSEDFCEEPTKIERHHTVDVFHFERFMQECNVRYLRKPPAIWLTIGCKPKSLRELFVKKGIQIELIPSFFPGPDGLDHSDNFSLYLSTATDMDNLLRQLNNTTL